MTFSQKETLASSSESLEIPPFKDVSVPEFFTTNNFKELINFLKQEFDYVICDTPPWKLFVDAKIISRYFDRHIYVVCNKVSSFKDINLFLKDIDQKDSVKFFFNRFSLFFNFLWFKYQYPYYSKNYYYEYSSYNELKKNSNIGKFLVKFTTKNLRGFSNWVKKLIER